jgi:site-specific DNA-adenine methylase
VRIANRRLRPFFRRFGSKWRIAPKYPAPKHNIIIEPFAGGAGYSLHYWEKKIVLSDIDESICGIWEYLIRSSSTDILMLPGWIPGRVDDLKICQEARWLLGYWTFGGSSSSGGWGIPSSSKPNDHWCPVVRARIAKQVKKIKHWKIRRRSYDHLADAEATWFIDPPYQNFGHRYNDDSKNIDYDFLREWVTTRKGQVIVCGNPEDDWLPFRPLAVNQSHNRDKGVSVKRMECIWYKER